LRNEKGKSVRKLGKRGNPLKKKEWGRRSLMNNGFGKRGSGGGGVVRLK